MLLYMYILALINFQCLLCKLGFRLPLGLFCNRYNWIFTVIAHIIEWYHCMENGWVQPY